MEKITQLSLVLNKKIINLLISKKTKFPNSFIDRKIIFQSNFNSKLQKNCKDK